jgi:hypothetical protein
MSSAVNVWSNKAITDPTLEDLKNQANYDNSLAKKYILQGGTLTENGTLKSGIGSNFENTYSNVSTEKDANGKFIPYRLGIRPMPGITGIDVKSRGAYGSLRTVTVNFQCWDVKQLEDLELLYMRPGYTVLVEWGWTPYLNVNGGYESTFNDFYSNNILNATVIDRTKIFQDLYDKCTKYGGNYDAIFGYVKNYQWSAREDGGYDCQTTIISTGEVIESIKVNYVRADLEKYKMYDTGSITGDGFLNPLFTNQGTYKSTLWAEYYQKNTLAGIWAELALKIKDPNAPLSPLGGTILSKKNVVVNYPGLTNYGNLDTFIQHGSSRKVYITLEAAFDMINEFILAKASNDGKPLITLSTKTETYSGNGEKDLLCVAHPVQISIDPTVCIIRNDLWSDQIANQLSSAVSTTATAATTLGDTIAQEIRNASKNQGGAITDGTQENDFLKAIRKIDGAPTYTKVNDSLSTSPSENAQPGLVGSIINEFNDSRGSFEYSTTEISVANSVVGITEVAPTAGGTVDISSAIGNLWYVYQMRLHLQQVIPGLSMVIKVMDNGGTQPPQADREIDFDSINTTLKTTSLGMYAFAKILDPSNTISPGNSNQVTSTRYILSSVTITLPSSATTAAAIVLNAADAMTVLQSMKSCDKQFFIDNTGEQELGTIGNIYVSLDFLYRQSLNISLEASDTKEKNEINLYSYIKGIMSGIQVAIGNLNNFEVHVDPVDNIARVIDVNYTGAGKVDYNKLFKLEVQNLNSIVRNYTLQSQIFPNQSAIVAIGSQAKGGQGGIQNKTMTQFNTNIVDRILGDKVDPYGNNATLDTLAQGLAGIIVLYSTLGYPVQSNEENKLNISEYISRAKNALRDLIVYFQNFYTNSPGADRNILPFKFSFETDGIGGLVIGSLFRISEDIIPKGYRGSTAGVQLAQTVTGIAHSLQNNDWTTKIDALNLILDRTTKGEYNAIVKDLPNLIKTAAISIINGGLGLGLLPTGGDGIPLGGTGGCGCIVPFTGTAGWRGDIADAQKLANVWTGGILPFQQHLDCTAVINYIDGDRYWLKACSNFINTYIVEIDVPYVGGTKKTRVHKDFALKLNAAFAQIKAAGLQKYIKTIDGGLAIRNNTNASTTLSNHAFGLALDLNASVYPNGSYFDVTNRKVIRTKKLKNKIIFYGRDWNADDEGYYKMATIMANNGITWLSGRAANKSINSNFAKTTDPMHFSIGE